ncbi:MAG: RNA polymerase sigma factor [Verrucomicrobia bacterium]|nr:RNA polymerase sigma factor [Verrucomicrobiota bacterium]
MTDTLQFEAFMKAYQDMVYGTAVRLLGNAAEAEDISQEVFLKAYDRFGELGSSPTAGGWLKTVTRNLCLNHLSRYRARWRFFSEMISPDEDDAAMVDFPAPQQDEHIFDADARRQLLEKALQKLPAAQRVPLVLFHFEELGYEEIAARLGVSLGKVKTDIFRAREALRKKLKLDLEGELTATAATMMTPLTGTRQPTSLPTTNQKQIYGTL